MTFNTQEEKDKAIKLAKEVVADEDRTVTLQEAKDALAEAEAGEVK